MPRSFSPPQLAALKIIAAKPDAEFRGAALVDQVQALPDFKHKPVFSDITDLYDTNIISSVGTPKEDRLALTAEGASELIALGLLEPIRRPAKQRQAAQTHAQA